MGRLIAQELKLRMAPITATVRFLPLGRSGPVEPYIGGGVGFFNWKYSEVGEFVDFSDNSIFQARYRADGGDVIVRCPFFVSGGAPTAPEPAVPPSSVVVVGASAGGVEALRALVGGMPADLPAAVVVVLHIARNAPSALPTILDRAGPLPAVEAVHGVEMRPGTISPSGRTSM